MAKFIIDLGTDVDNDLERVEELLIEALEDCGLIVHELELVEDLDNLDEPLDIEYRDDDDDEGEIY